ncbi:hypothetical protein [Hyphomonas sp.]|uniref:hypothetical protein n=1 Tax=Hyphomonas sp. TaxID=87 RepID=UPI00391C3ACA
MTLALSLAGASLCWPVQRALAGLVLAGILSACGVPEGEPETPDLSTLIPGTLLDEIDSVAGEPAAAAPVRRPVACELLSAEVASELIGEAAEERPAFQTFNTIGHTHTTQCDRHSALFRTTNISLFVSHNSLPRQTPEMTQTSALQVVRDRNGAEPIDGIGNWAVLDMDRRLVVAGDRLFFFVHFNDGTGLMDTRAILENAARTLWASLEEYDS